MLDAGHGHGARHTDLQAARRQRGRGAERGRVCAGLSPGTSILQL